MAPVLPCTRSPPPPPAPLSACSPSLKLLGPRRVTSVPKPAGQPLHQGLFHLRIAVAALRPPHQAQTVMARQREEPKTLVVVGTYTSPLGHAPLAEGEGIYVYRLSEETGDLTPLHTARNIEQPSFLALAPTRSTLYATNELPSGMVTALEFDFQTGALKPQCEVSSEGQTAAHITVMGDQEQWLLVANYAANDPRGAVVAVLPVREEGWVQIGTPASVVLHEADPPGASGPFAHRQSQPHPHQGCISPDGRFVYVPDLGLDRLFTYAFDMRTGALTAAGYLTLPTGSGPRHMVFHPNKAKPYAYLLNELSNTITAFEWEPASGGLKEFQTVSALPEGDCQSTTGAAIRIHPRGNFLYASTRGLDSLVVFALDQGSGCLRTLQHISTGGACPRDFNVDPSGRFLHCCNQDSDSITVFSVDETAEASASASHLQPTGVVVDVPAPVCVLFVTPPATGGG